MDFILKLNVATIVNLGFDQTDLISSESHPLCYRMKLSKLLLSLTHQLKCGR